MIVITESWLSSEIEDAELNVPGWILYRSDRGGGRSHGGCAVYIRNNLTSQMVMSHSNSYCESIGIKIKTLETLVICTYRPPDSPYEHFKEALENCQEAINQTMQEKLQVRNVLYFGDFNFPNISWPTGEIYSSEVGEREKKSDDKKQSELLLEFARENFLEQTIDTPTRGKNILDLVFTNNPQLINYYNIIVNSKLSDHNTVETNLNFSYNQENKDEKAVNPYSSTLFEYDSKGADDELWERFSEHIGYLDPEQELSGKKPKQVLEKIVSILEKAAEVCLEKKSEFENKSEVCLKKRNFIPKRVKKLLRKKEKLSKKVMKSNSWIKNFDIMKELEEVEAKLDLSYQSRRKEKEKDAILKINKSPNYFYSYAKRFSKTSNKIGNLINKDGTLVTDPFEKAEILRKQYESVVSQPKTEYIVNNPSEFFDCKDDGYESLEEGESVQLQEEQETLVESEEGGQEDEQEHEDQNEEDQYVSPTLSHPVHSLLGPG